MNPIGQSLFLSLSLYPFQPVVLVVFASKVTFCFFFTQMLLKKIMNRNTNRAAAAANGDGGSGTAPSNAPAQLPQQLQQQQPAQPGQQANIPVGGAVRFKTTALTNYYEITETVLGLGINGKVLECYSKADGKKYALKVSIVGGKSCVRGWGRGDVQFIDFYSRPAGAAR